MPGKPRSVDEYLSRVRKDQRVALETLREHIKSVLPKAEECISYQIPAFRLDGKVLVWFGAGESHCAFYPGALPIATHAKELAPYKTSKGTVRFQPDNPLPATLVRKLIKTRIAERSQSKR